MTPGTRIHRLAVVCLFVVAALAVSATDVFASHFRYGTITWTVTNPAKPNVVTIRFDAGWAISHLDWRPARPTAVGQVVAATNLGQITVRNSSGVNFGPFVPILLTVTAINPAEDWFAASFETTITLPATTATYTATFTGCCRISTLRDSNADRDYFIRTDITVRMPPNPVNQPPTSAIIPIVTLANGRPASVQLPGADPNGDQVSFRLSTLAESGLQQPAPLSPAPGAPGAFQLSSTGRVQWTPDTNGLYAVQMRLTDSHGAFTVIDALFNVVTPAGETPFVFINGRPAPEKLTVVHGSPISFTVKGIDPENTPVALSSSGLPVGSSMTPSLPLTAINASSTFNWTPAAAAIGTYVMSFATVDGAGLQGIEFVTLTVTNNRPLVECTTNGPDIEATSAAGALFTISAGIDDIDGDKLTIKFFVDGEERKIAPLLVPPASRSLSTPVALGLHAYEVRVDDGLAARSCIGRFAVRDTTAPSIIVDPGDQTLAATSRDGVIAIFTVTAHDDVDAEPEVICSHASGATFPIAMTTVTCSATDAAGNHNDASFVINVIDPDPPTIDPHADLTVEATSAAGAIVNYLAPATHDAIDGDRTASCLPAPGSTFALGGTTVTCSARDAFGNPAVDTTFTVTVADTTPPAIDAHADVAVSATSPAGAVVKYIAPATHDAVDGDGVATCTPVSGTTFAITSTAVTCSAVDARGNRATDTAFNVIVTNHAPTFAAPANITAEATSRAGAIVSYSANGDDVEQGTIPAVCSPVSGSTFALGVTTVFCTVTDVAGATASGSFTVTVRDTTPPAIVQVTPSTTVLAARRHSMQSVAIVADARDAVTAIPMCSIADITSNEAQNGRGDGNTAIDWEITGPLTLNLRAERSGAGDGRVYTVTVGCADAAGNRSTASTTVAVPK